MTVIERAARWAGVAIDGTAVQRMDQFADWLRSEAAAAGGIGPNESTQIESRHIADSLVLARAWRGRHPGSVVDLGTGAGLPGVPLAICHPQTTFLLLDRSGRRCRLLRRAVRILGLENVEVEQRDIEQPRGAWEVAVSRATASPSALRPVLERWLRDDGVGVIAGSTTERPIVEGFDSIEVPATVLDHRAWILIMAPLSRRTDP